MMIWYSEFSLAIREIANGVWTLSSLALIMVVICYVLRIRRVNKLWYHDPGVQFAFALVLLISGYVARSLPSWLELILLGEDFKFLWAIYWFPPAVVLVLLGKILCMWSFTPPKKRLLVITLMLITSFSIPVALYLR